MLKVEAIAFPLSTIYLLPVLSYFCFSIAFRTRSTSNSNAWAI
ncbi:hypothetical protein COO91_00645 [Nostoc flagelliforme CCNUN1]|uniref:Uncharacterized protein n=1 Tax=Nostoc flagelliforme CCNUN1 TaxID=2038116 RepID=A0A2K8SH83_9NOSO|nr:hypothetical protein COO91_00645 [Nostoc flagelliforme CCNUN1]